MYNSKLVRVPKVKTQRTFRVLVGFGPFSSLLACSFDSGFFTQVDAVGVNVIKWVNSVNLGRVLNIVREL